VDSAILTRALAAIRAAEERADAATPGPWYWWMHFGSKIVQLVGAHTRYVMGFERWGMQGAAPTLRTEAGDNGYMARCDRWAEVEPGREHHAEWHRRLVHPDTTFIAHARTDVPALAAVAQAAARVVEGMAQGSFPWWCDDLDKHDQCRVCYRRALRWQDIPHAGDCAAMALEDALTALAGGDS